MAGKPVLYDAVETTAASAPLLSYEPPREYPHEVYVTIGRPDPEWRAGLFDCGDNLCNCGMGLLFPCVTYGQVAERVGHNGICDVGCFGSAVLYTVASAAGLGCVATCILRQRVAEATGVPSDSVDDCVASLCCEPCVLCQMANHLGIQRDRCSFGAPPRLEVMER